MQGRKYPLSLTLVNGGADVTYEGKTHALRTYWRLGDILLRGTCGWGADLPANRAAGAEVRVFHWGIQVDAMVMTARAAELLALMPESCRRTCPSS